MEHWYTERKYFIHISRWTIIPFYSSTSSFHFVILQTTFSTKNSRFFLELVTESSLYTTFFLNFLFGKRIIHLHLLLLNSYSSISFVFYYLFARKNLKWEGKSFFASRINENSGSIKIHYMMIHYNKIKFIDLLGWEIEVKRWLIWIWLCTGTISGKIIVREIKKLWLYRVFMKDMSKFAKDSCRSKVKI